MVKIRMEKVDKIFKPNVVVLEDVNLEINDKEFMVLVGPSGCGKSTTLNLVAGLEYPSAGKIFFDDIDVTYLPPKERRVAMVFQSYALYPHMNVKENMSFSLRLSGMEQEEIDKRVKEAAELLGIPNLLNRKPKELSGGQRQRVALGRCIVRNPTVFLFDEPLSNLDAKLRIQMRGEIIKLQEKLDITLVYVTHDQVEAMSMADRIAILFDGIFQQIGTPVEVYNEPRNQFVAGFIGSPQMNFFDAKFKKNENKVIFANEEYSISNEIKEKVASRTKSDDIILGIRPEHIKITPEPHDNAYEVEVTVVEFLGAETMVTIEFPDGTGAMAVSKGHYKADMGDKAYLSWSNELIHIFDKSSELNLIHYREKPTD
ncbi:MAG: putative sugar transporter subunit: ATP-binding component of ABC superfamily transporter [Promethearchaeota archaeon]|nr:MAG: putative sugar transporter subunit: ATP-binding component of ABC superfamily transporter [Candidatus Lokiarchaeota archaeon]